MQSLCIRPFDDRWCAACRGKVSKIGVPISVFEDLLIFADLLIFRLRLIIKYWESLQIGTRPGRKRTWPQNTIIEILRIYVDWIVKSQITKTIDCFPPKPLPMQEESFHGRSVAYAPLSNGHRVRILYKTSQLEESIYPDLNRLLQEGGFQAREDLWGLLTTVAVGGEISLNGPRYPNPKYFKPHTMHDVFMRTERTLAQALMTAVFCKEVPYGGSPISIQEIQAKFEFRL